MMNYPDWNPPYLWIHSRNHVYAVYNIKDPAFKGLGISVHFTDGRHVEGVPVDSPDPNILCLRSISDGSLLRVRGDFQKDLNGDHLCLDEVDEIYLIERIGETGYDVVPVHPS